MVKKVREVQSSTTTALDFPAIVPRSSDYRDQYRTEILIPDQICLIHNLLTPENCRALLKHFHRCVPLLAQPSAPRRGEATRTNERYASMDPKFAEDLYRSTDLSSILEGLGIDQNGPLHLRGLNSNIRIYRYQQGAFFGPHYDDSVTDAVTKCKSAWTLLIYLTEGELVGGETSFEVSSGHAIAPQVKSGMALIHRHGKDCLLHEGRPVAAGIKWVLRSDLMYS